jgi:hypothetical protein
MTEQRVKFRTNLPPKQGLYDPSFEHDSCGTGFVVNIKGIASHQIISHALTILIIFITAGPAAPSLIPATALEC